LTLCFPKGKSGLCVGRALVLLIAWPFIISELPLPPASLSSVADALTNLIELSPSRETASCATTQEIRHILYKPEVHYRVHKSRPLVPVLSQTNTVHTTVSYLRYIFMLSTHIRVHLRLPSGLSPCIFPTNLLYAFLFSRSTFPINLIVLDLTILIILVEEYKLRISLWSFLQPHVTS
jgi:hypothetical protein